MDGALVAPEGSVVTVVVPPVLNDAAKADLTSALELADENESVRVILLTAQGDDFGIGEAEPTELPILQRWTDPLLDPWRALRRARKPVVASLKGRVENASAALALASDLRLGDASVTFLFDAVARGAAQLRGVTPLLTRIIGPAHAADMLLTARAIAAEQARELGLLNHLVPSDALAEATQHLTTQLALSAPIALQYAKEAIVEGCNLPIEAGCRLEHDLYLLLQTTQDRAEGIAAFLEKRPPIFRGE